MKILILCPSLAIHASGNACTVQRIQKYLVSRSIDCVLCDVATIAVDDRTCARRQYTEYVMKQNFDGVVLLHAYKSGKILICKCTKIHKKKCSSQVALPRYAMIFGGTDLNNDIYDKGKCEVMQEVLKHAVFAVAFTQDLKMTALKLTPELQVFVQPQAVNINTKTNPNADVNSNTISGESTTVKTFLMVTGIRPVKDPLYILDVWMKWCEEDPSSELKLLILGPVLDDTYARKFFDHLELLKKKFLKYNQKQFCVEINDLYTWLTIKDVFPIFYASSLSHEDLFNLMHSQHVFAAVNSSVNEGMSSAILESMANKLPVIARDIPGNNAVIVHRKTGLLFRSPKDFVEQAKFLISNPEFRCQLVRNAYKCILEKHSTAKESDLYCKLCRDYFATK